MSFFSALVSNRLLINAVIAWATAQILKTLIYAIVNHHLDINRLLGESGMPSAHSATVTCLAISAAVLDGVNSQEFAICAILAFIVMHDAMGVRRQVGKQAKVINRLTAELPTEEQLKELLGHTPLQVVMGAALGFVLALLLCLK